MANTHSKSSSEKSVPERTSDTDYLSLSVVKELLSAQESAMKSFFAVFVDNSNTRIDKLLRESTRIENEP